MSSSSWALENIDKHLSQQTWESFMNHYVAAGMLLGATIVCVLYPVIHSIYLKFSSIYRNELSPQQQTTVVQHTIEAVLLWLLFFPLSWIVFSLFFEEQPIDDFQKKFNVMAVMVFAVIMMYLIEIAARYQSLRPLVVVHHLCALLDCVYPVIFMTTENIKAACLLNYFITYEALIFVGLVLYRLQPSHPWTPRVILAGMIMFGASRPIQLIWIVSTLAVSWNDLNSGHALFQLVLTALFTFLQLYSLSIHWLLYKKLVAERAGTKTLLPDDGASTRKTVVMSPTRDDDDLEEKRKCEFAFERTTTFGDEDESSTHV